MLPAAEEEILSTETGEQQAVIARVRATPVNIPLEAAYLWSVGSFPGFTKTIVEVEADDGTVGVGEAPNHRAAQILDDLGPRLWAPAHTT
jgi:L-alanine-DL-glutamate epimerase-like enolase superfamily enzyme